MPGTSVDSAPSVTLAKLVGAAQGLGDDVELRPKGKDDVTTAKRPLGQAILRFFPFRSFFGSTKEEKVTRNWDLDVYFDMRAKFGRDIANRAYKWVRPDQSESGRGAPITAGQVRALDDYARALTSREQRRDAAQLAVHFAPEGPGFGTVARDAGVDPAKLTTAQKLFFKEELQRQVSAGPGGPVTEQEAIRGLAVSTLHAVAGLDDAAIDLRQDRLRQAEISGAHFAEALGKPGIDAAALMKELLHLRDDVRDAGTGDSTATMAMVRALDRMSPKDARALFKQAMAPGGAGLALLHAAASNLAFTRASVAREELPAAAVREAEEALHLAHAALLALGQRAGIGDAEELIKARERASQGGAQAALEGWKPPPAERLDVVKRVLFGRKPRHPELPKAEIGAKGMALAKDLLDSLSLVTETSARKAAAGPAKQKQVDASKASASGASASGAPRATAGGADPLGHLSPRDRDLVDATARSAGEFGKAAEELVATATSTDMREKRNAVEKFRGIVDHKASELIYVAQFEHSLAAREDALQKELARVSGKIEALSAPVPPHQMSQDAVDAQLGQLKGQQQILQRQVKTLELAKMAARAPEAESEAARQSLDARIIEDWVATMPPKKVSALLRRLEEVSQAESQTGIHLSEPTPHETYLGMVESALRGASGSAVPGDTPDAGASASQDKGKGKGPDRQDRDKALEIHGVAATMVRKMLSGTDVPSAPPMSEEATLMYNTMAYTGLSPAVLSDELPGIAPTEPSAPMPSPEPDVTVGAPDHFAAQQTPPNEGSTSGLTQPAPDYFETTTPPMPSTKGATEVQAGAPVPTSAAAQGPTDADILAYVVKECDGLKAEAVKDGRWLPGLNALAARLFLAATDNDAREKARAAEAFDKAIANRADELIARARSNTTGRSYAKQVDQDLMAVSRAIELLSAAEPPQGWNRQQAQQAVALLAPLKLSLQREAHTLEFAKEVANAQPGQAEVAKQRLHERLIQEWAATQPQGTVARNIGILERDIRATGRKAESEGGATLYERYRDMILTALQARTAQSPGSATQASLMAGGSSSFGGGSVKGRT